MCASTHSNTRFDSLYIGLLDLYIVLLIVMHMSLCRQGCVRDAKLYFPFFSFVAIFFLIFRHLSDRIHSRCSFDLLPIASCDADVAKYRCDSSSRLANRIKSEPFLFYLFFRVYCGFIINIYLCVCVCVDEMKTSIKAIEGI